MLSSNHYDLSVIESWKALEARLRRVLLLRGLTPAWDTPEAVIAWASRAGIVREPALSLIHNVRHQWAIAVSTEPLSKEAAEKSLQSVRDILATISVQMTEMKPAA